MICPFSNYLVITMIITVAAAAKSITFCYRMHSCPIIDLDVYLPCNNTPKVLLPKVIV